MIPCACKDNKYDIAIVMYSWYKHSVVFDEHRRYFTSSVI